MTHTTTLAWTLLEVSPHDRPLLHDARRIRAACARDLHDRFGEGHWAHVTSLPQLCRVAQQKHLYLAQRDGETLGTFVLGHTGPSFLTPHLFHDPTAPAMYLTALAVLPARQGEGVGRWCMQQAEAIARRAGCRSLRFDAYDHPAGAWAFYDGGGYERRAKLDVFGVKLIAYERVL